MNQTNKDKTWIRVILIVISSLGIILPIIFLLFDTVKTTEQNNKIIYSYNINQDADYKVELFDNSFINQKEMEPDQIYIADLTKNINLNFNYTYSGTKDTTTKYNYEITGTLYGETQDTQTGKTNKVWTKKYQLNENEQKTIENKSGFTIVKNLSIDYQKYKEEVTNFKRRFGMAINTKLQVTMTIKLDNDYNINRTDKIVVDIPLGVQAFSITKDYENQIKEDIYANNKKNDNTTTQKIYLGISLLFIIILIITVIPLLNIKKKNPYTKQLNKILKNYGQIIVEVENPIKEKNYNIVKVKDFEEMLDLEEELKLPIILYTDTYHHKATFTITKDDTIYKYIIKDIKKGYQL